MALRLGDDHRFFWLCSRASCTYVRAILSDPFENSRKRPRTPSPVRVAASSNLVRPTPMPSLALGTQVLVRVNDSPSIYMHFPEGPESGHRLRKEPVLSGNGTGTCGECGARVSVAFTSRQDER
jgi:hypothetical protein